MCIDKRKPFEAHGNKGLRNQNQMPKYSDTFALAQGALGYVSPVEREVWLMVAMALKDEFGDAARDMWELWSQQADNYKPSDANSVWRGIQHGGVGIGSLFHLAQQNGWSYRQAVEQQGGLTHEQYIENAQRVEQARQAREKEQIQRWQRNAEKIKQVWQSSHALDGNDAASRYLANRELMAPATHALRWREMPYYHENKLLGYYPALLAAVTDHNGEPVTIHRTYLTPHGTKADVPTVKMLMPTAAPMRGSSIKLYKPQHRNGGLSIGVAEGIETAIAAQMLFDVPVWPCIAASGIASFTPPGEVKQVYLFADNDTNQAGQEVAHKAAERLTQMGFVVRVHIPPRAGIDWADVLVGGVGHE